MIKAITPVPFEVLVEDTVPEALPEGVIVLTDTGRLVIGAEEDAGNYAFDRAHFPNQNIEILTEASPRTREVLAQGTRNMDRSGYFIPIFLPQTSDWSELKVSSKDGGYAHPMKIIGPAFSASFEYHAFIDDKPVKSGVLRVLATPSGVNDASYASAPGIVNLRVVADGADFAVQYRNFSSSPITLLLRKTTVTTARPPNPRTPYWRTEAGNIGRYPAVGVAVNTTLIAEDGQGGFITYALVGGSLPPGLTVNTDGVISGTITATGVYTFTMRASNSYGYADRDFEISTLVPTYPPVWETAADLGSFPEGDVEVQLTATDPEGQEVGYSLTSGALPAGLLLSSTGTITGHTEAPGSYSFEVTAFDGSLSSKRTFSMTINDNLPPVWVTNAGSLATVQTGGSVSLALLATDPEGGNVVYSIDDGLPGSLDFDGLHDGVAKIGGFAPFVASTKTFTFNITAIDPEANQTTRTFAITVSPGAVSNHPPTWTTDSALGSFTGGQPLTIALVASDSDGDTLTYSLTGGSLPPGMSISSAGKITGTLPTVASDTPYSFTVAVTDNKSAPVSRTFSMTVRHVFVADATPNPVDWTDISASGPTDDSFIPGVSIANNTNIQSITGINVPITLRISASRALASGEQLAIYLNGSLATQGLIQSQSTVQITVNDGDQIRFRFGGFKTTNISFTVQNMTDGNAVLDTFGASLTQTNDVTCDPVNWSDITVSGPTDPGSVPGVSIAANTNSQSITGIVMPITLSVTANKELLAGEQLAAYVNGSLAATMVVGQTNITFNVSNNDAVLFRCGGYDTDTVQFTVVNTTDHNRVLDTFVAALTKTN